MPPIDRTRLPKTSAPSTGRIAEWLGVAIVFAQVLLVFLVARELDIQTSAFRRCIYVAMFGFVLHHFLAPRFRNWFFSLLSLGTIVLVLGAPNSWDHLVDPTLVLTRVVPLVAIGLSLIAVCHIPIGFWYRAALLAAMSCVIATFRHGLLGHGPIAAIWPVLASMFMFRLVVYLYDVSTAVTRPPLARSFSYFFLFPNATSLLFPVIDFKKFAASSTEAPLVLYQRGATWMARGTVQLVVYRFVDHLLFLPPDQVTNGTQLAQFALTNSLLYLNVSGQFHLIVGMLLLFGFNLPRPNHHYFLASSFTDYWRRVNIYWMDFMTKIVYYPTVFRLKSLGPATRILVGTAVVFVATWALHLYQTWWLKGSASASWPDAVFWSSLGLIAIVNSWWEYRHGRSPQPSRAGSTGTATIKILLKTAGTFACVCALWSVWTTPSVSQWIRMCALADRYTALWAAVALATVMVAKFVMEIRPARGLARAPAAAEPLSRLRLIGAAAPLLLIYVLAQPAVLAQFDAPSLQPVKDTLVTGGSMIDGLAPSAERGYYENLTEIDESNQQLLESYTRQQIFNQFNIGPQPRRPVRDLRRFDLIPSWEGTAYATHFVTNRWGMRDRDYEQTKPPGTFRIALLGSSNVMGFGVRPDETFESILENRFNAPGGGAHHEHVEILNFAESNYDTYNQMGMLDQKVKYFGPDVVLYVAHLYDYPWVAWALPRFLQAGIPLPYPFLQQTLREARVIASTHQFLAQERLEPYESALLAWSYHQIVERAHAMGAVPVLVYLPIPNEVPLSPETHAKARELMTTAANAGFSVVDMSDVFAHEPKAAITLGAELFDHYNPHAHALIASELYERLNSPPVDLLDQRAPVVEGRVVRANGGRVATAGNTAGR